MATQILLADDHQIIRDGMKIFLEREGYKVNAEAENGREAVNLALRLRPDVAILDIIMPILNGLDAAREIICDMPGTRTILLTMHNESSYVLDALRIGVNGFVTKTHAAEELVQAIHHVLQGKTYLRPDLSQIVLKTFHTKNEIVEDPLTLRERQVLQLVAEGKTTRETAKLLNISTRTTESHRACLMKKLNIHEIAGLVRYAIRRGMILP